MLPRSSPPAPRSKERSHGRQKDLVEQILLD
jgi:hypothetical protein